MYDVYDTRFSCKQNYACEQATQNTMGVVARSFLHGRLLHESRRHHGLFWPRGVPYRCASLFRSARQLRNEPLLSTPTGSQRFFARPPLESDKGVSSDASVVAEWKLSASEAIKATVEIGRKTLLLQVARDSFCS